MATWVDMAVAAAKEHGQMFEARSRFTELRERAAELDRARSVLRELERLGWITPRAKVLVLDVLQGRGSNEGLAVVQDLCDVLLSALRGGGVQ